MEFYEAKKLGIQFPSHEPNAFCVFLPNDSSIEPLNSTPIRFSLRETIDGQYLDSPSWSVKALLGEALGGSRKHPGMNVIACRGNLFRNSLLG